MNEEYVIDESWKAKAVKAVEYDQTKKQVIVLEDGKPLFVWMYPLSDYRNIDEALSKHFGVDMYVVPHPALVPGSAGWLGSKGVVNGGISGIEQVVHVYEVIALPIVY